MSTCFTTIGSPIGELLLTGDGEALTGVTMQSQKYARDVRSDWRRDDTVFRTAAEQLAAYFGGALREFNLPLAAQGTAFQRSVWRGLLDIPFGRTESYGSLARRIGAPKASRAVGLANGHNPIAIIVPCHRVIGANGSLTGYGGGIERKRWLLAHEAQFAAEQGSGGNPQPSLF